MKKSILIIITLIIIAIFIRFFASKISTYVKSNSLKEKAAPTVVVETVDDEEIIQTFEAPGRVVSKYQVSIIARVAGYLQKTYFKEGDNIKAGDILFLIEPLEYLNASKSANANLQNIKAQLSYAEKQLIRAEELIKNDYIAKSKYDEILSTRNSLLAQLEAAKSNYSDSKRNLSYTQIKAPIEGRIGIINVSVGNYVSPSSGALTTINSTDPIYVTFPLSSENYSFLTKSDGKNDKRKIELFFRNGEKYEFVGIQDFLDNKIDQSTGTVTMRATFKNPENKLIHGEFVNVKLYANNKIKLPVVPVTAVQENQEGKFVYLINSDNLPELTYIEVNGKSGPNWIIKSGLKSGDRIITEGFLNVIPRTPVKIISKSKIKN